MTNEELFQSKLIRPLIECYGQVKFPVVRIRAIWEKLKHTPTHLFSPIADKVILNFDMFPGVQKILDVAAEVSNDFFKHERERLKSELSCHRCRSQGVIIKNNLAYKCTCRLGDLCYPGYAVYQGQIEKPESQAFNDAGDYIFENSVMSSHVPKGCKSIKEIRTIIKSSDPVKRDAVQAEFKKINLEVF
jgi:hypothetical protein